MRPADPLRLEYAVFLYEEEGLSQKAASEAAGLSRFPLARELKRRGTLRPSGAFRPLTNKQIERAVARYVDGKESTKTAGPAEGMSAHRLATILRERGLIRSRSEAAKLRAARAAGDDDRLEWSIREYVRGLSMAEAEELTGVKEGRLRWHLEQRGLMRTREEASFHRHHNPRRKTFRKRRAKVEDIRRRYLHFISRARFHDEPRSLRQMAREIGISHAELIRLRDREGWPHHTKR